MRFRLSTLLVAILIVGVVIAVMPKSWLETYPKVDYFTPSYKLPENLRDLAEHVQTISATTDLEAFGRHISVKGLDVAPKNGKDNNYLWTIPATDRKEPQYVLTAHFSSFNDAGPGFYIYRAAIRPRSDGAILTWTPVWQIIFREYGS